MAAQVAIRRQTDDRLLVDNKAEPQRKPSTDSLAMCHSLVGEYFYAEVYGDETLLKAKQEFFFLRIHDKDFFNNIIPTL